MPVFTLPSLSSTSIAGIEVRSTRSTIVASISSHLTVQCLQLLCDSIEVCIYASEYPWNWGLQGNLKVLNKGSSTELTKRVPPVLATMGASSKVFNTGMLISDGFTAIQFYKQAEYCSLRVG